jgi:probable HAF family extracellular repeat protein
MVRMVRDLLTVALLAALASPHGVNAQSAGTFTDLGTLGGTRTLPLGMNDLGDVVGSSFLAGDTVSRPFLWSGGVMQQLPLLPGHTLGSARAINNLGQIVGISSSLAVRWDNGAITDLNTAATAAAGWIQLNAALGINDAGQIVGFGQKAGHPLTVRAFLLDNGVITDLGTLGGGGATAWGINNAGQVVGQSTIDAANANGHAYSWTNGVMTDLGGLDLGGVLGALNIARSINEFGEAAGSWRSGVTGSVPLFWDATGSPTVLPGPDGTAQDINNLRQIVGGGSNGAVLWEGGAAIDLETLISPAVELSGAQAINNVGQIAGQTTSLRGFLIQLPARPTTISGLISGLVTDPDVQHSLLSKLDAAINGGAPLCNVLRAARNEIDAQSGQKIPSDVATRLLDAIDAARTNCP